MSSPAPALETASTTAHLPRINDPAPEFEAKSTQGPLKLSDYTGKWIVLFSHPANFTPVCTTEFVEFAKLADAFQQRNVQLIGLSVDSVPAHIAWVRNIEQNFNVKINFPVIADLDMKVARKYGLIHPSASETATVRAVFVIDGKGLIRALVYYPLTTGRNIDELLRLIDALQTTDANAVSTPANWQPGDAVIVPPPQTLSDAEKRLESDYEVTDWYFAKKRLS